MIQQAKQSGRGADHITHLYNAMPPLNHREPGVIEQQETAIVI